MKRETALRTIIILLVINSGFTEPFQLQTLVLNPLPKIASVESDFRWTETEALADVDASSTSLRLHHRDSLAFNSTPEHLFNLRLLRDISRVRSLTATVAVVAGRDTRGNNTRAHARDFSSSVISGLSQGSGEYFTRLGVGTPPQNVFMVLDTGSDIVWLQCAPCRRCYSQADPVFVPAKSRSFSGVECASPLCHQLDVFGCDRRRSCLYQVSYGDGSFTVGEFSTETLTFRGARVGKVPIGCGHDNEGLFVGAAGLLGLGRGKLSFPSQTGKRFNRKFSYCLVDRTSISSPPSSVMFGDSSMPKSTVFTPMITNPKLDTFYYVNLVGISVGGSRVSGVTSAAFRIDAVGNGGVIVDSGTSVTRLTRPAYVALRDAFRARTTGLKSAPGFSLFDTCYDLAGKTEVKVPTLVLHFAGNADVSLPAANYLIPVASKGIFCFAFAGTSGGLSIVGNIQQQGFRVVFDGAGSRVGFAPNQCT